MERQDDEEEEPRQELKIGLMQIINALKAKMEKPRMGSKGRMFVEAKVGGQGMNALIDPGATNSFLDEKEARSLGIP